MTLIICKFYSQKYIVSIWVDIETKLLKRKNSDIDLFYETYVLLRMIGDRKQKNFNLFTSNLLSPCRLIFNITMKIKSIKAVVFVIVICSIWLLNFLTIVPSLETSEFSNIKQDTDERYLDIYKMDFAALKRIDFARFFSKLFLMIESQKFDYRFMSTRKFQNYFIFFQSY